MTEADLKKVYDFSIYPRDSVTNSKKVFVNIDNGSMGESHSVCFCIKDQKSYYFDSFGGSPDKFSLKQLPKPITCHNLTFK